MMNDEWWAEKNCNSAGTFNHDKGTCECKNGYTTLSHSDCSCCIISQTVGGWSRESCDMEECKKKYGY